MALSNGMEEMVRGESVAGQAINCGGKAWHVAGKAGMSERSRAFGNIA